MRSGSYRSVLSRRGRYPHLSAIFFQAKTAVSPTLEIIEDYERILAALAAKGVDVDAAAEA